MWFLGKPKQSHHDDLVYAYTNKFIYIYVCMYMAILQQFYVTIEWNDYV